MQSGLAGECPCSANGEITQFQLAAGQLFAAALGGGASYRDPGAAYWLVGNCLQLQLEGARCART